MAIVREYYLTRKDGVKLYKTYSDKDKVIRKVGTNKEYDLAIDVENSAFVYEETDKDIEKIGDNEQ